MKTAIIVLNYNDYDNTQKFVKSIQNYNILNKIVIVDNYSSKKDELSLLKKLECSKVDVISSEKNGGYAYGNNYGLYYLDNKYGKDFFDYVISSNPDAYVSEETIEKSINFLQLNKNSVIAAPRMFFKNGPARRSSWKKRSISIDIANSTRLTQFLFYFIFKKGEYLKKDFENDILKVDAIAGSFFIADINKFRKIGYFDENTFLFYEEDILGEKAKRQNYDIYSLNKLKFIHYDSQTIGKLVSAFKKQDILFDSRIYFHKKYNKANFFQITILNILRYVRKFELLFEIPLKKLVHKIIDI